jgi:hypothetical protein
MALWSNKDTFAITGTIGVPNASTTVTGVSTLFTTQLKAHQTILIAGVKYKIASITSPTVLTLAIPYAGTTIASGATITGSTIPNYVPQADLANVFFVDETEAQVITNRNRGILGGGWWKVVETLDSDGSTRYRTECLVAMGTPAATSSDAADDTVAADVVATITIGTQPTAQTTVSGAATFTGAATVTSGTVTYQWQKALAASPAKFANVSGATSASIVLAGQLAANTGDKYRVIVSSTTGADRKTSNAVALTFGT